MRVLLLSHCHFLTMLLLLLFCFTCYFPGTGKSTTVVETILQLVFRLSPGEHILVCASSNSATDLLVEKLAHALDTRSMFRAMAYQRSPTTVSDTVRQYCHHDGEGFVLPSAEKLQSFQVIVATSAMAGKLYNVGIKQSHFRTVVVDEAGHPEETGVYQAVAWMLDPRGLLVLAGDPKQLGPVTYSRSAFSVSMLERLLAAGIYARDDVRHGQTGGYDPSCLTKLIFSYRCHPAILRIPNQLFYNSELQEVAWGERMLGWHKLPNPKFPFIFHGVNGTHAQESNSPSWFNVDEIEVVAEYLAGLLDQGDEFPNLSIGVIAPYQKQVSKIRQMMSRRNWDDANIKVGSCEQFQGSECDVIIITTVRSTNGLPEIGDTDFNMGFVENPKRLNVAVTRAKSLLIIVGNPDVLEHADNWKAVLTHCKEHDSCIGYGGFEPFGDERFDFFPPDTDGSDFDDE
jgi:helicase MOV-10